MSSVLQVQDLGKSYRHWGSERRRLASWFIPSLKPLEENWVLKDVSFSVAAGEAIAIIGQNGAGKSTLLKLITGTTYPTQGRVQVYGRVSAILELGMGFSPELTGRQNAYHAAGLMGYSQADVARVMPAIEAFADIGDYFDQPLRTYSSGMQMRVAFSVVTAIRPDLLIVDEALSVGDVAFQRKCFRLLEDFVAQGTSLLFVSHDLETVRKICQRAVFIEHGQVKMLGTTKEVCDAYESHLFGGGRTLKLVSEQLMPKTKPVSAAFDHTLKTDCDMSYGDGRACIEKIWLEDSDHQVVNVLPSGDVFTLNYQVRFKVPVKQPIFSMLIKTREGIALFGTDTSKFAAAAQSYAAGDVVHVQFSLRNVLAAGIYYFNCGVRDDSGYAAQFIHRLIDVGIFRVTDRSSSTVVSVGLTNMNVVMTVNSVSPDLLTVNEGNI